MHHLGFAFLFLSFFMLFGSTAQAAETPVNRPGITIYRLGEVEVIAVRDQISDRSKSVLLGDAKRIETLMPETKTIGSLNTFVVRTKHQTVLIDTGWGAPRGQTLDNLNQIGITPTAIDAILFTHLHGDHVSGLVSDGKRVFPNASVYVPAAEHAYWFNDEAMNKSANKNGFITARQNLLAYGDKVNLFEPGIEVIPGITSVDEKGHTPGHVGYLVESGSKKLLIWGDLTHFNQLQLTAPEIAVTYDVNPEQAIASRKAILAWVASENIPIAGMHILYPGVGRVHNQGDNSYVFEPLDKLD